LQTALKRYEITIVNEADGTQGRRDRLGTFDETVTIGRSGDSEVRLEHATVSHKHAIVEASSDGFTVLNLSARGSTFVSGQRLEANESAAIPLERAFVQIGQYLLEIRPVGQTQPYLDPIPIPGAASGSKTLHVFMGPRPRFQLGATALALPPKPGRFMVALALRPNRTTTRDALVDAIEDAEGWTNLDAIVFRLRARLDEFGKENPAASIEIRRTMDVAGLSSSSEPLLGRALVLTVRGQGYRLALPPGSVLLEADD
jgi:hypothetical protein